MAKATMGRHLLLTLVLVLIAVAGLMFWGSMSNPAYANDRGDVREIELINAEDSDLWSDDTLRYDVQIPDNVDYDSIRWIVGVRGEDDWETVLGDRDNEEKYYEYDAGMGELLLHGDKIFEEIGEEHLDIYVNVKNGSNVVAEGFDGVDIRESRYEYDLPQDNNILPEWDVWVDKRIRVWIRNKTNPDGHEDVSWISTLEPVSENVDKILEMDGDYYGWSYKGIDCGTVRFCVTYMDLGGEERTHYFNVNVSETVYEANLWTTEGVYQGLPGSSIELQADSIKHKAEKQGSDPGQWRHWDVTEGLVYKWSIVEDGKDVTESRNASIAQDPKDPTKATVNFKDIYGKDIDGRVEVALGVTDSNSDDPGKVRERRTEDLWIHSEYHQIYPAIIDPGLDVGKTIEIDPEVRFYRYGVDGYSAVENVDFRLENYDTNDLDVSEESGKFVITRKSEGDINFDIKASWKDGDDRDVFSDNWYHLDRKDYGIWFKYDHTDIYADQNPVHIEIETEDLDSLKQDIEDPDNVDYGLRYTIGVWDDIQEEFVYTMPIETYSGDFEGLHFDASDFIRAVGEARAERKDIDGLNARVELIVNGQVVRDSWIWLNLRETCMENGRNDHNWIKHTLREKTCIDPGKQVWICLDDPAWGGCGEVRWFEYAGDSDKLGPHALTRIPARDSTLTATGNIEHYKCKVCDELFSDAAGTKQITQESTVIAKKIDISGAAIAKIANRTYNKSAQKPAPTVKYGDTALKEGVDYTVAYANNVNAGTAKVTITGKGKYGGAKDTTFTIAKASNPLTIKARTATVKYSAVKKKAQTLAVDKVINFTKKGQGKMTYTKSSGSKKITIAKTTGKVTVKKGLKKGTYKVKVKVKAAGNANYKASAVKTVTFKVKVK